jgi:nitrite reductase/ring-hydroxylating ferredoxin subunit
MSESFIKAISASEIAPGGMKALELEGNEIVICNSGGKYYAIQRRCGHMNAPLEMGTLDGIYLTCPMHCAQFDVTNGDALSGPVPSAIGNEIPPPFLGKYLQNIGMIMKNVRTETIRTYTTKLEAGWIQIKVK